MSAEELAEREAEKERLQGVLDGVKARAATLGEELARAKEAASAATKAHQEKQQASEAWQEKIRLLKGELAVLAEDKAAKSVPYNAAKGQERAAQELRDEVHYLKEQIAAECAALATGRAALEKHYAETAKGDAETAAREELATPSTAAEDAAEAGGGALPRRLGSALRAAATVVRSVGILQDAAASGKELRAARQALAGLTSSRRSLDMQVMEAEEGLRQWGFMKVAIESTDEMRKTLGEQQKELAAEITVAKEEKTELEKELQSATSSLQGFRQKHQLLQSQHQALRGGYQAVEDEHQALEQKLAAAKALFHERFRQRERLAYEHEKVCRAATSDAASLEAHPQEAVRRSLAAHRLAEQAEEQVRKNERDLERTQAELASFRQVHAVLLEAHRCTQQELANEETRHTELMASYRDQSRDLAAMAEHYVEEYPGIGGFQGGSGPGRGRSEGQAAAGSPIRAGARLVVG